MTLAILGGSFNPPHLGHLMLARTALDRGYRTVLLVPAAVPPHKGPLSHASADQRWDMVVILADLLEGAMAWNGELTRGGASYSIDTVRQVRREFALTDKPGLILGDDLAEGFGSWRDADTLAEEADLLLARRNSEEPVAFPWPCTRLENPIFPHSSTAVRKILAEGGDPRSLVPSEIARYIARKGLYTSKESERKTPS